MLNNVETVFLPFYDPIPSSVETCYFTKPATNEQKVRCPQLPKVGQQSGEGDNDDPFTQNLLSFTSFTLREEYLA